MTAPMENPAIVWRRLAEIEADLAERQNEVESAAVDVVRVKRDYELRKARAYTTAKGSNQAEREAQAILALAAASDGIYAKWIETEARYEGVKAAVRVLEHRASIGQSLLRSQGRQQ